MSPIIDGDKEMMEGAAIWYGLHALVMIFVLIFALVSSYSDYAPKELKEAQRYKGQVFDKYNVIIDESIYEGAFINKPTFLGIINLIAEQFGIRRIYRDMDIEAQALRRDAAPFAIAGRFPDNSLKPTSLLIKNQPNDGYKFAHKEGFLGGWKFKSGENNSAMSQIEEALTILDKIVEIWISTNKNDNPVFEKIVKHGF